MGATNKLALKLKVTYIIILNERLYLYKLFGKAKNPVSTLLWQGLGIHRTNSSIALHRIDRVHRVLSL